MNRGKILPYFRFMIFVSGATGLVGSHLLFNLLQKGEKVRALYRNKKSIQKLKKLANYYQLNFNLDTDVEWIQGDITDMPLLEESVKNCKTIYNCAGFVSFIKKDFAQLMKINVEGTANLVNAALNAGCSTFCHVSSTSAIGFNKYTNEIIDETIPWEKSGSYSSNYSLSKYLAEREVWRGGEEGLNICIVNPAIIIGPGNWGQSSTNLIHSIAKGMKYYTSGVNGFVDVRDVCNAMLTLVEKKIYAQRYLIVSESMSYKELFTLISKDLGKKAPSISVSPTLAKLACLIENLKAALTAKPPLITKETIASSFALRLYSNQKIKEAIGFEFTPIHQAITNACQAYKYTT
jgi:dihydroflavonol-4-reductase